MKKINLFDNEIMTMPQYLARYAMLALKIEKLEKKLNKQFGQIRKILNKLAKTENEDRQEIGFKA